MGCGDAGHEDDDHSLGMMSPVAAYEADYMSLVQASDQATPPTASPVPPPLRLAASASASTLPVLDSASPPGASASPISASIPLRRDTVHVVRCASGPAATADAPISASPATPATPPSPPILAAPGRIAPAERAGPGLRCGHDWRDLDRSCKPDGDEVAAAATGTSNVSVSAMHALQGEASQGDVDHYVGGRLAEGGGLVSPPDISRGASYGSCSGVMHAEDVPDSAAALQNAAEQKAAAAEAALRGSNGAVDGATDVTGTDLPPVPRPSMDAAHRQLGFEARRAAGAVPGGCRDGAPLVEQGLVIRLVLDGVDGGAGPPYVRVIISPWVCLPVCLLFWGARLLLAVSSVYWHVDITV